LKVGDKPIIQYNFERLHQFGVDKINVTLRYLGQQLIDHFGSGEAIGCNLDYVTEEEPLGTIGAVKLIDSIHQDYVILMNSDILTNIDYEDFFEEFIERDADMAVATIPYEVDIPYAVLELNDERLVASFKEKPTYTYFSNAGIYLIKKALLSLIPEAEKYDATDFMNAVIDGGHRLISYPIRGYWLDIGKHADLDKAQKDIDHIQF
jgi:NDP-sugar pyrophosphorylase family protein